MTRVLTPREARVFASVVDAAVAPGGPLPPVAETDAVESFAEWLRAAPRTNRVAIRALLHALNTDARLRWLERTDGPAVELLLRLAAHCYYGDERVMRRLGYVPRGMA